MSRYSPCGYIIALRTRSAHTVLAEGKNDQAMIKYCLLKIFQNNDKAHSKYVIDTADIIESDGKNFSNRAKLQAVHFHAKTHKLLDRVTCFADREYDGFDISSREIDLYPYHKVEEDSLFYTRGHSVENYFFSVDYLLDYIEFKHARDLQQGYRTLISKNWDNIVLIAASLSLAIAQSGQLNRCLDLFNISHWQADGETINLDEGVVRSALSSRSICPLLVDLMIKDYHDNLHKLSASSSVCRWLAHGHIGLNIICSGIARMLRVCGMTEETSSSVIGFTELKMRYLCEKWHSQCSSDANFYPVLFFKRVSELIT